MGEIWPRLRQRWVQCVDKSLPASKAKAACHSLSRLWGQKKKCVVWFQCSSSRKPAACLDSFSNINLKSIQHNLTWESHLPWPMPTPYSAVLVLSVNLWLALWICTAILSFALAFIFKIYDEIQEGNEGVLLDIFSVLYNIGKKRIGRSLVLLGDFNLSQKKCDFTFFIWMLINH